MKFDGKNTLYQGMCSTFDYLLRGYDIATISGENVEVSWKSTFVLELENKNFIVIRFHSLELIYYDDGNSVQEKINLFLKKYRVENAKYPNMLLCNFFNSAVPGGLQNITIDEIINVHKCKYKLIACSYGDGSHFKARFLWENELYQYDGLKNGGTPVKLNVINKFPPDIDKGTINTLLYKKVET
jgi:hypothetical protein